MVVTILCFKLDGIVALILFRLTSKPIMVSVKPNSHLESWDTKFIPQAK